METVHSSNTIPNWKKIKLDILKNITPHPKQDSLESEVAKYVLVTVDPDVSILKWWKKNSNVFPQLSKLAKILLAIPAISAPSEWSFSASGSVVTAKRSRISPLRVKKVLFIHDNFNLISA